MNGRAINIWCLDKTATVTHIDDTTTSKKSSSQTARADDPNLDAACDSMTAFKFAMILLFFTGMAGADSLKAQVDEKGKALVISSVQVNDKSLPLHPGQSLRAGANPETVTFNFGPATNSDWMPNRLRYRLDGYDSAWHEGNGEMNLTVRFFDRAGDLVGHNMFNVSGNSAGWRLCWTNTAARRAS